MKAIVAVCLMASSFCLAQAKAEGLPTGTHPLAAGTVAGLYADKTIKFPGFDFYFDPDHTIFAVAQNRSSYGIGRWSVNENTICTRTTWWARVNPRRSSVHSWCNAWYSDGKAYWTRVTQGKGRGHVYKGNASLVRSGDQVWETMHKLRTQFSRYATIRPSEKRITAHNHRRVGHSVISAAPSLSKQRLRMPTGFSRNTRYSVRYHPV